MMTESKQNVSPDWRRLCEELVRELHGYASANPHHDSDALVARAREALAQPEPEVVGPTDEELLSLDQLRDAWNAQADAMNSWTELGVDEIVWWAQHQALARRGCPSPAPAGAVAELVAWLRENAEDERQMCESSNRASLNLDRAADLLERQAAPVPVAISERLPGVEDCDAEGRCWFWQTRTDGAGKWELCAPCYYPSHYQLHGNTHWLPAHALPIPEQGDH